MPAHPLGPAWWEPDAELADALTAELSREVGPGHPLFGKGPRVLVRCDGCDEVAGTLHDGGWFGCHLSWPRSHPDVPPWPRATMAADLPSLAETYATHQH